MSADVWVAVGVAVGGIGFLAALRSIVRDKSRGMDATLDALLDSDPDDDEPEAPEAELLGALEPAQVLAMTPGQIAARLRPLDEGTHWSIHPALQRRPRPYRRDPFDFFADGGM